jgi:nicotinamidase/pyrazinamidase
MTTEIQPTIHDVLAVMDIQNDFCHGGSLAVPDADAIVPLVNLIAGRFTNVVLVQDWHPPGHSSFASAHSGRSPYETITASHGAQILWPDHCVQGTSGAEFHPGLCIPRAALILRKGHHPGLDSYSAFFENDRTTPTGLTGYLRERDIRRLFCVGLATDFCVRFSALDARRAGFDVVVILGACRAIDRNGSLDQAIAEMKEAGVEFVESLDG